MATTSEIQVGMAAIAARLSDQRQVMIKVKANAGSASVALAAIPNDFADVIATVTAYGTSNAYEATIKAQLTKMTAEFNALKAKADAVAAVDLNS
ncbi:hypothetical protein EN943_20170 [Mesorhizobium sp. M7A.F.Ca.US.006.01.1.1]|uniref:hypothetical protein n=1 Tax=Mesorhizobium sp. M7A.F.Ca.US.006.01.1.1 TaxID=2496707 RepID=UPI000FCCCF6B|nr:hypothetical protein [Mesorhizobium sp. M7A.F.Ca.US.006.01.1.1]RUZ75624.1 hypothetical protein EN943_20170 [Mesorhizobium sp. M7A.F.Ca.US.006.01.1.1]